MIQEFINFFGLLSKEECVSLKRNYEVSHTERWPCYQVYTVLYIDKDGFCYPCCAGPSYGPESELCIGNIRNESISKIIKSNKLIELRKIMKKDSDSIDVCKNCFIYSNIILTLRD